MGSGTVSMENSNRLYGSRRSASLARMITDASRMSDRGRNTRAAARELGLAGDGCPSSTVAMTRMAGSRIDLLALGDSSIFYDTGPGTGVLTDDRLAELNMPQRQRYRERLAAGHGYDDTHRELLRTLQREQRKHATAQRATGSRRPARTRPGGPAPCRFPWPLRPGRYSPPMERSAPRSTWAWTTGPHSHDPARPRSRSSLRACTTGKKTPTQAATNCRAPSGTTTKPSWR
jgi:hypothetical protein